MAATFLYIDRDGVVRIERTEQDFKNPPNSGSGPYQYPPTMAFLQWIQASEYRWLLPSWETFQVIKANAVENTQRLKVIAKSSRGSKKRRKKK